MKFFTNIHSFNKHSTTNVFNNISGYNDLKAVVIRALDAEDNYNLLFVGP